MGVSPDGRLASGQSGREPQNFGEIYNVATSTRAAPLPHQGKVNSLKFSRDMTRLATCSWDRTVNVWEPSSQKLMVGPLRHTSAVYDAEFSPDNRYLLTVTKDATACVWDLSSGQVWHDAPRREPDAERQATLAPALFSGQEDIGAAFRPGHDQVLIVDAAGWLHIWDWRNSTRLWPAMRLFTTPDLIWNRCRSLTLSLDGRFAAVGGKGALHVVDLTRLDDRSPQSANELIAEAELLSGRRLTDNGVAAKLTFEEWIKCLRQFRHKE